jgi:hypothetical protein
MTVREKIRQSKRVRAEREALFEEVRGKVVRAMAEAYEAAQPTPMNVVGGGKSYYVSEGVCGMAYISLRPRNHWFAKMADQRDERGEGGSGYHKAIWWTPWRGMSQSMERNVQAARAGAAVVREYLERIDDLGGKQGLQVSTYEWID